MQRRQLLMGATAALTLGACSGTNNTKFKRYDGPEVTQVVVSKQSRLMYLMHKGEVLEQYNIRLGFAPIGHKYFEGDGRTPEGRYYIDRRNPNSKFHLSVGISYPNPDDVAMAEAMGKSPGGDIFIHGQQNPFKPEKTDWTWGCIAVTNEEIEDIYSMVRDGTPIVIGR